MNGLRDWKKIRSKTDKHASSETHKNSVTLWAGYMQAKKYGTVGDGLNSDRAKCIQENRRFLKTICKIVILCARQDIGLRGHREGECSNNQGNFLEILKLVASQDGDLKRRLEKCPGNATYISKTTQNDLLIAASDVIKEQISSSINRSGFFSVIADEARDVSRMEQLSLCIRYVHPDNNSIQEHFVGFTSCYKLDATSLATQIISEVEKLGLSMKNCLAQCYDGLWTRKSKRS